jgi:hypothetical protein
MMGSFLFVLLSSLVALTACDNQTKMEKVESSVNDVKRSANKAMHRLDEKTCAESDLECLAEKAKHRTEESYEYVEDKTEEGIDKLD